MQSLNAARWAMGAGVNSIGTDLVKDVNNVDKIKSSATQRVKDLVNGNSNATQAPGQLDAEVALVTLAIEGIQLAYVGVSAQLLAVGNQRLAFLKERETGTATFVLPANKESRDLFKEEKFIKYFVEITTKKSSFSTYSGQHSAILSDDLNGYFYSVLPFYRMSECLGHPIENRRAIDKQRRAISLFLKVTVPEFLEYIDGSFQTESHVISFFSSMVQGTNYINDKRAARFIIMSLANLLWNLQHPVDPETGFPLSFMDCIKLCRDVELYLDGLLDNSNKSNPCCLLHQIHDSSRLISFIRKISTYTSALKAAYTEEQLHEVNLEEVTNSAHQALEIMDKSIFNLIYQRENNESTTERLIYIFDYLRDLFMRNSNLSAFFVTFTKLDSTKTYVNDVVTTVMDVVIIFCHMPKPTRKTFLNSLLKSSLPSVLELSEILNQFNNNFIVPVELISKRDLHATMYEPMYMERAILSAQRLIPFITLVLEGYNVEVDTPDMLSSIQESCKNSGVHPILSGKKQIEFINQSATVVGYYQWTLAPFANVNVATADALNDIVKHQHRLTEMTQLLDSISELIQDYRTFLNLRPFQTFLLNCLHKAKDEYAVLAASIGKINLSIADDESILQRLKQILFRMSCEMSERLEQFSEAERQISGMIGMHDFIYQEKQLLEVKINLINQQYFHLFGEVCEFGGGVSMTIGEPSHVQAATNAPPIPLNISSNKIIALSQLAHLCFNGMSYLSQTGYKGMLFNNLITKIDEQSDFNEIQFKHAIMELVCLTASYRETSFFQALYGQTRSAKILIHAIKDPVFQRIIPLGAIIFNTTDIDYSTKSEIDIIHALESLRTNHNWQESAGRINMVGAL